MSLPPILITTFQPWRAHQTSNSSDDLVLQIQRQGRLPANSVWLRHVPVSFDIAPARVMSELHRQRPRAVVCCGMAEKRPHLSLEQQATCGPQTLTTDVDVAALLTGTLLSAVSYDAGSYVCNHLYYAVLRAIKQQNWRTQAIFVHVPILTAANQRLIAEDFLKILARMT